MVFKCWIGKNGCLVAEVERLISLINSCVITKTATLVVSPAPTEGFNWICDEEYNSDAASSPAVGGSIGLYTSGTTGQPKLIWKDFGETLARKKGAGSAHDRWLLTFNPGRWAGLSVIMHAVRTGAELVIPDSLTFEAILSRFPDSTHVSLTPSLFRKLQMCGNEVLKAADIQQVTFGGEYATQKVLDDAKTLWPNARITHIYATTELGDVCSASDGLEGYPITKFSQWSLKGDGEVCLDGIPTGDMWEIKGERFYYKGRNSEVINVGGAKVTPTLVELHANTLTGIDECRAFAVDAPLLGQVVGLEYVGSVEPIEVRKYLLQVLPKYAVPAKITKVETVQLTPAGKLSRN